MIHIQCPKEWDGHNPEGGRSLFLGGGISGTKLWQPELLDLLADTNLVILNPRREVYPKWDDVTAREQIKWEFTHLKMCGMRMFWFPPETLCPITLFELGKWCEQWEPLFVGCDPEYKRKSDVEIQLELARPNDCKVSESLEGLASRIKGWYEFFKKG